jgi:hypothetical protein
VKYTVHESSVELVENARGLPLKYTLRSAIFAARVFVKVTRAKPVVPEGPVAVKLSCKLVELNVSAEIVELDSTEKMYMSPYGITFSVELLLAGAYVSLPAHSVLIVNCPVSGGIQVKP